MSVYPEGKVPLRTAVLSPDEKYRYLLRRQWTYEVRLLTFIMLNPSTADDTIDDPTIRRCVAFARRLNFSGLKVVNLYAYRATSPKDLWKVEDPVGSSNDAYLRSALRCADERMVIAAWGANAKPERVEEVMSLPGAENLYVLGLTKKGAPRHPLYLPGDSVPRLWRDL